MDVEACGSVGCTLGMSDVSPFRAAAALDVHTEFPEEKKKHFQAGVFWGGRISGNFTVVGRENSLFSGVLIGLKSLLCFTPLHVILKFMPPTAARCCKKQQQRRRLARSSTRRVF